MSKLLLNERIFAESAALLSRLCASSHILGAAVVGDSLRVTPMGYHVANTTAEEITGWAVFSGDPEAGSLPKNYTHVGIVDVKGEQFAEAWEQNKNAVPAVAWTLGNAVMVGEIPRYAVGDCSHDFKYGMRIGTGELQTAPVLWARKDGVVWAPDAGFVPGDRYDDIASVPTGIKIY